MEYLTPRDVQKLLGIGDTKARKLMRSMPHLLIGSTLRVDKNVFEAEMHTRTIYPTEKPTKRKQPASLREKLIKDGFLTPEGNFPDRRKMEANRKKALPT